MVKCGRLCEPEQPKNQTSRITCRWGFPFPSFQACKSNHKTVHEILLDMNFKPVMEGGWYSLDNEGSAKKTDTIIKRLREIGCRNISIEYPSPILVSLRMWED